MPDGAVTLAVCIGLCAGAPLGALALWAGCVLAGWRRGVREFRAHEAEIKRRAAELTRRNRWPVWLPYRRAPA
jgi:hypothetical protein